MDNLAAKKNQMLIPSSTMTPHKNRTNKRRRRLRDNSSSSINASMSMSRVQRSCSGSFLSLVTPSLLLHSTTNQRHCCHAFITYREALNPYELETSNDLPVPLSDMAVTTSMAPNINGDLVTGLYLIGGCQSDYVPFLNSDALAGLDTSSNPKLKPLTQYRCAEVSSSVTFYDPSTDYFAKRKDMDRPRHRHVGVAVGGAIWVVGGRDGKDQIVSEVEVYDPGCEHWVTLGTLPAELAVSDAAYFVHEEDLYVAGGYRDNYEAVRTTFKIDTEATLAKNGHSLCGLDGNGGGSRGLVLERVADLNTERGMVSGLSYGAFGYVVGGYTHRDGHCDPHKSVEIYNVRANVWEYGGSLSDGRAGAAVAKHKGRFFVVGGEKRTSFWAKCSTDELELKVKRRYPRRKSSPVNSIEVLDPLDGLEGEWAKMWGGLPRDERYRFALAPSKGGIISFGGVTNEDFDGMTPCEDCLHVIHDILIYKDETERYETETTWWGEFWVIVSSVTFAATLVGALIGQIPAIRILIASWWLGGRNGTVAKTSSSSTRPKKKKNQRRDQRHRSSRNETIENNDGGDIDDIALVGLSGGRRDRLDSSGLSRGELL